MIKSVTFTQRFWCQTIWTFIHLFSQLLLETLYHIPYSKLKNTRWLPVKDISVLHLLSVSGKNRWVCWQTRWKLKAPKSVTWKVPWWSISRNSTAQRRCCSRYTVLLRLSRCNVLNRVYLRTNLLDRIQETLTFYRPQHQGLSFHCCS